MKIMYFPASIGARMGMAEYTAWLKDNLKGVIPIVVNDIFLPALDFDDRYQILYGGSGSGKSEFKAMQLLTKCLTQDFCRVLYVRKEKSSIKDSQFQLFTDQIKRYGLEDKFSVREWDMSITCFNGNKLVPRGLDDVSKLTSITEITDVWIEEPLGKTGPSVTLKDFTELDRRVRTTLAPNHIHMTFNPIDRSNWVYEWFFDKKAYPASVIKSTYRDNYFASKEAEEAKFAINKIIDENEYLVFSEGEWGSTKTGREFYSNFSRARHVRPVEIKRDLPVHCSLDQNVIPHNTMTAWQLEFVGDVLEMRAFDEICMEPPLNQTDKVCEELIARHGGWMQYVFLYGDASGGYRNSISSETHYDIAKRILQRYVGDGSDRVLRSNPQHKFRRAFAQLVLAGGLKVRIIIDPKCEHLIEDLRETKQDINGAKDKERGRDEYGQSAEKRGHESDTFDYLLVSALQDEFDRFCAQY